jgi:PIN domain nuclease of toxin-antitoxin system
MKYVVDTHALIWFLEGNPHPSITAKTVLVDPVSELILPAIALAEAVWIVDRGWCLGIGVKSPSSENLLFQKRFSRLSIHRLLKIIALT